MACSFRRRIVGAQLLEEAQHHAQNHHDEDHHGCPLVPGQIGKNSQRHQKQDQRILDVAQEAHQAGLALLSGNLVGADLLQARFGFRLAEPAKPRMELPQNRVGVGPSLFKQVRDIERRVPSHGAMGKLNGTTCLL
jgi:hypothetical protein